MAATFIQMQIRLSGAAGRATCLAIVVLKASALGSAASCRDAMLLQLFKGLGRTGYR